MNALRVPVLSLLFSLAALLGLFFVLKPERFDLSAFSLSSVLLACLLMLFTYLMGGLRLKLLASYSQEKITLFEGIKAHLLGLFSAAMTPSGTGHAPMIALSLAGRGIERSKAWSVSLYSNVLDMLCYAWMLPLALLWMLTHLKDRLSTSAYIAAFTGMFVLLVLFYLMSFRLALFEKLSQWLFSLNWLRRWYKPAMKFVRSLTKSMSGLAQQSVKRHLLLQLVSAGMHIAGFCIFYVILKGMGLSLPFVTTVILTFLVLLLGFVIPTPGASGYAEATASLVVGYGQDMALILPAVFLWRLISHYSSFVLGPLLGGLGLLKDLGQKA